MHRLNRASVGVPASLQNSAPGRRYTDLKGLEKNEIRSALLQIQGHRCAYCERRTGNEQNDGHIEHFRSQAQNNGLSLDWSNLFWACQDERTCGKHKDKCTKDSGRLARFDPAHIVKPDEEEPSELLTFIVDGTIRLRDGLGAPARQRAEETLRVFQLNESAFLRRSREDAVKPYIRMIDSLTPYGRQIVGDFARREVVETEVAPFSTTIRQYLEGFI